MKSSLGAPGRVFRRGRQEAPSDEPPEVPPEGRFGGAIPTSGEGILAVDQEGASFQVACQGRSSQVACSQLTAIHLTTNPLATSQLTAFLVASSHLYASQLKYSKLTASQPKVSSVENPNGGRKRRGTLRRAWSRFSCTSRNTNVKNCL